MVRLRLRKPKHRAQYSYARAMYADLYRALHAIAHNPRVMPAIRRVAVFSVRGLAPRPAPPLYTKRVKNLEFEMKESE